jgi:hypothetical protein
MIDNLVSENTSNQRFSVCCSSSMFLLDRNTFDLQFLDMQNFFIDNYVNDEELNRLFGEWSDYEDLLPRVALKDQNLVFRMALDAPTWRAAQREQLQQYIRKGLYNPAR